MIQQSVLDTCLPMVMFEVDTGFEVSAIYVNLESVKLGPLQNIHRSFISTVDIHTR